MKWKMKLSTLIAICISFVVMTACGMNNEEDTSTDPETKTVSSSQSTAKVTDKNQSNQTP